MNAYGAGGTAGRVAALMAAAEKESVRRAEYNPAWKRCPKFVSLEC